MSVIRCFTKKAGTTIEAGGYCSGDVVTKRLPYSSTRQDAHRGVSAADRDTSMPIDVSCCDDSDVRGRSTRPVPLVAEEAALLDQVADLGRHHRLPGRVLRGDPLQHLAAEDG